MLPVRLLDPERGGPRVSIFIDSDVIDFGGSIAGSASNLRAGMIETPLVCSDVTGSSLGPSIETPPHVPSGS